MRTYTALSIGLYLAGACCLPAQTKPEPDKLIFVDGETLLGEFQSATGATVTFKSAMGFVVTVPWGKIKELQSKNQFAAIHKAELLRGQIDASKVPQGTLEMTDQKLEITPAPSGPTQTIPVKDVADVLPEKRFEHALERQSLLKGWTGVATLGLGLTEATTSTQSVTSSLTMSRTNPSENWLDVRDRSLFTFNSTFFRSESTGVPDTNVDVIHSDIVHDHYLNQRAFIFAGATFDHNYSQGLELLQAYGGGIGGTIIKNATTEFEARAGIGFMDQMYVGAPRLNQKLVGSRFGESITKKFGHGFVLYEQAGIRPAWNDLKDLFGGFIVTLNVPLYHRLGANFSSFDSWVNNPPPYFKHNSFQLSMGLNYTIK